MWAAVQRHERGDVVGVDGHRSRPLVQARGEVRQDRSSLAMGTAARGGRRTHRAALGEPRTGLTTPACAAAGTCSRTAPHISRRSQDGKALHLTGPPVLQRAARCAHGVAMDARLRRGKFGLGGGQQPVRGRHHNGSGPFPSPIGALEDSRRAFENACFLYFGYDPQFSSW